MKRIEGFLFLDNVKKELAHEHSKKNDHYWVYINGEEYYFKPTDNCYNELIGYQAATFLGIDACFCDLAILNGKKGIISKSLRNKKTELISGLKILSDYAYGSIYNLYWIKKMMQNAGVRFWFNESYSDGTIAETIIHNLENVWHALDYKYKDDKRFNIKIVMNQIVKMFIFTLLSYDVDRYSLNWMIEESDDTIKLAALFDNEYAFNYNEDKINQRYKFTISTNPEAHNAHQLEAIEKFLSISSSEYFDLFYEMYETLVKSFDQIIKNVEAQIGTTIPNDQKSIIINGFNKNMMQINNIFERFMNQKSI